MKKNSTSAVYSGEVIAVNEKALTCQISLSDGSILDNVHLKVFHNQPRGAVSVPTVGKKAVLVKTDKYGYVVIAIEEIEKTIIVVDKELLIEVGGSMLQIIKAESITNN